jgi:FixJ family two-component response regulator
MTTAPQPTLRCLLLVADAAILQQAATELAEAGPFRVKAYPTPQKALPGIPAAQPYLLVVQNGASIRQLMMARQVAELAGSRKVPIVMFGGPLDEDLNSQRQRVGIWEVVEGDFQLTPVLEAVRACLARIDQMLKSERIRRNLARAAERLRPTDPPPS